MFLAASPPFQIFNTVWKLSWALAAGALARAKMLILDLVGGPHWVFTSLIFLPFFSFLFRSAKTFWRPVAATRLISRQAPSSDGREHAAFQASSPRRTCARICRSGPPSL